VKKESAKKVSKRVIESEVESDFELGEEEPKPLPARKRATRPTPKYNLDSDEGDFAEDNTDDDAIPSDEDSDESYISQ
jgi:hypothetical protein